MWTVCEPRRYWQTITILALAFASIQQLQAQMTLDGSVGPAQTMGVPQGRTFSVFAGDVSLAGATLRAPEVGSAGRQCF